MLWWLCCANVPRAHAGGLTLITHGLNGNINDWVTAMGQQLKDSPRFPGTNYSCYKLYFIPGGSNYVVTWSRLAGSQPALTDSGEIVVLLDWGPLSDGSSYTTYQVANAVVPALLQTNFISELAGHSLAEMPIHLVGHSRGGSLICQISRLLGTNGIWVDHLTTLDPHPLNNDGFFDFIYSAVDAPCATYENVLFHDNYYQLLNSLIHGEQVAGSYHRQLTYLTGGYEGGLYPQHSDVHLWYHGTVELDTPAYDNAATLGTAERQTWWSTNEASGRFAGFYYSLLSGGDRLSTNQPASSGSPRISDGYNQLWSLGAGVLNNRTALPTNNGGSANAIKLDIIGTNFVAFGQTNNATLFYQWAKPASSNAVLSLYLDDDLNPYNGNERLIRQFTLHGTTAAQVSSGTFDLTLDGTNASPGYHTLYAKITVAGHTRCLYAPQGLTVVSSFAPLRLALLTSPAQTLINVSGIPGQRFVLQTSANLRLWQSLSTNWLATNSLSFIDAPSSARFYRAVLQ